MNDEQCSAEEAAEFVKLLQRFTREEQKGVYLVVEGAKVLSGKKNELFK